MGRVGQGWSAVRPPAAPGCDLGQVLLEPRIQSVRISRAGTSHLSPDWTGQLPGRVPLSGLLLGKPRGSRRHSGDVGYRLLGGRRRGAPAGVASCCARYAGDAPLARKQGTGSCISKLCNTLASLVARCNYLSLAAQLDLESGMGHRLAGPSCSCSDLCWYAAPLGSVADGVPCHYVAALGHRLWRRVCAHRRGPLSSAAAGLLDLCHRVFRPTKRVPRLAAFRRFGLRTRAVPTWANASRWCRKLDPERVLGYFGCGMERPLDASQRLVAIGGQTAPKAATSVTHDLSVSSCGLTLVQAITVSSLA